MIIEFKVANYRSVHAEQTLSFVADRATRHPGNLIKRPGYRLLKAIGLFGANASGKSNIVKALGAMSAFVRDSATRMNDGDPILAAEPYRLDPQARNAPSRFEITFVTDGTVYTYGFAADRERVREEWLEAKTETSEKKLFDIKRSTHHTLDGSLIDVRGLSPTVGDLLTDRTRDNALFLSSAARENVKELSPAYRFMRNKIWTFNMSSDTNHLLWDAAKHCKDDAVLLLQASILLRDADTGIENMSVNTVPFVEAVQITQGMSPQLKEFIKSVQQLGDAATMPRITTYRRDKNGNGVEFDLEKDESHGTNKFFALVVPILDALISGALVVVDEIDASMHPLLTRKLLEMFQSPEANPNGAQLLFTTHDPSLLDQELFRRDQVWLAEKCDGASTFFSLADIHPPIRNTESFLGNYLTGRYGGTPHLGPAFDMIETGRRA